MNNIFDYQLPNGNYRLEIDFPNNSDVKIISLIYDDKTIKIVIDKDNIKINNF